MDVMAITISLKSMEDFISSLGMVLKIHYHDNIYYIYNTTLPSRSTVMSILHKTLVTQSHLRCKVFEFFWILGTNRY